MKSLEEGLSQHWALLHRISIHDKTLQPKLIKKIGSINFVSIKKYFTNVHSLLNGIDIGDEIYLNLVDSYAHSWIGSLCRI